MEYMIKHKIPTLVIRILFGLFLLLSGMMMLVVAAKGGPDISEVEGPTADFLTAVVQTGYLWKFIGLFKLVTGILVLVPRTAPLGIIAAFPYSVNILLWVIFVARQWAVMGIPDFLLCCYLIYAYFDRYKSIIS
jgi:hypothetical protein